MYACLKDTVVKERYPVAIYRNQSKDKEMLRVDGTVAHVNFLEGMHEMPDVGGRADTYYNDVSTAMQYMAGASNCFTMGAMVQNGRSSLYWKVKDANFWSKTFESKLRVLGLSEPVPEVDPFGITSAESIKSIIIVKGKVGRVSSMARLVRYGVKQIDYNADQYDVWVGKPNEALLQGIIRTAAEASKEPCLFRRGRIYVTFNVRRVALSGAGQLTAARTYAIGNTDARKEATIDSSKAQLQRNILQNMPNKGRGGGLQFEVMVTVVYRKKYATEDEVKGICERFGKVVDAVNSPVLTESNASYRNAGLVRARFNWDYIRPEEALRLYVSQGFYKGKDEDFGKGEWSADFSREYLERFMVEEKTNVGSMVSTEGYMDRAIGVQDIGYLFWQAGPTAMKDMRIYNGPGGLIVLPFYLSARNRLAKGLPKSLDMFASVEGRDLGYDPRYITEEDYKTIMTKARLRMYIPEADRDFVIGPGWENMVKRGMIDEDGYEVPKGEDPNDPRSAHTFGWVDQSDGGTSNGGMQSGGSSQGAGGTVGSDATRIKSDAEYLLPKLKDGDVTKLYSQDDYLRVSRLKFSENPMLGIVKNTDGTGEVIGPSFARKEGSRILVVGGSGGGKTTVAAPAAVEALECGGSVVAADMSGDFLEKVLKISLDRYEKGVDILDRIFIVKVGDNTTPSVGSMNFLHPRINGVNRDLLWNIISGALNAGREQLYGDAFGGPKIEQYVKALTQVLYDLSVNSTLVDAKYILQNPEKGADILKNLKAATGKGPDSAYESIFGPLKAQSESRYKDEFASSVRYLDGGVGSYPMKRMLNDRGSRFRFEELLRPDKPMMVILYFPASVLGDREASLLVAAYLTLFYALKVALNTVNDTFENPLDKGKPLTYSDGRLLIIADEFQKYWNEMLKMALTEGRKQNVSIMLLTQTIRVPDLNGKPLLESHRNDFNFVLVKGVKDTADLKLMGIGNESTYDELVRLFVDEINGVTGAFYMESSEGHGKVSTLYQISEHDPVFFDSVMKAFYKRYEELDNQDGMGRLRMLSDAQVEEMSLPLEDVDARNQFGVCLDLYYLDKYYKGQTSLGDLTTFNGKMLYGVGPFRRDFHIDVYFPELRANSEINAVLKQLVDVNSVRRDSYSDRMMLYGILENGVAYLKQKLGSGKSGGGDDHRAAVLEIARNIVAYNYKEFNEHHQESMVYAYPSVGGNGPDLYINLSEKPKMVGDREIKYAFGEVQMGYRKALVVEKLNALPKGWGMIFYVPKADIMDFQKGLNNIVSEDLDGKDASEVLSRVFVQSMEDARQKLDALKDAFGGGTGGKAGAFADGGQGRNENNGNPSGGQTEGSGGSGTAWGFNEEQTKAQLAYLDSLKKKGDLESLKERQSWMKAFGVTEINDVGIPVDVERHNAGWTAPGGMKDIIKEVRNVGYACGFKVLRREDVVVYTGIPGSGILSATAPDAGSTVADSSGAPPGGSQKTEDSVADGSASDTTTTEKKDENVERCENWNKMLFMSKQSWPIEKNIKEFNHQGEEIYIDVLRAADIILTMHKFIALSDPVNGEKLRKYVEGEGYLVTDFTRLRLTIKKLLSLQSVDIAPEGKLANKLEDYLIRRGVIVKLNPPEIIKEYASLVGKDEHLIRVVDLREINEIYYPDFCKHWDILIGYEGSIFLSVEKVIDRFGKK
ncbi:MAG: hypothetical protein AMDU3_IPLC00003G0002 [Thermoplasmatales archaeon I-plasma]|nr:MAG: hypothetical protein AMDU3_IPLC00003G0002 [Thermoplasmatales archaeon I-plasma]